MNMLPPRQFDERPAAQMRSPLEIAVEIWRLAMRHKLLIATCVAIFVGLGAAYIAVTPKQYLASADMIIDPRKTDDQYTSRDTSGSPPPVDSAVVESQGEVLKSENVAIDVIKKLNLVNDPTFNDRSVLEQAWGLVAGLMSSETPGDPTYKKLRETIDTFESRLTVKRIGVTYLFEISFLARDPKQAADIANAVAEAYVQDDLQAKYNVRLRAANWMRARLKDIGEETAAAEHKVDDFKRSNQIIDTGGRLLDEQRIAELQSQLSLARTATSEAKAKVDRIEKVTAKGALDLSVADAISNQVIINLRDSYVDLSKREADLSSRLGPNHEAPKRLRADMAHIRSSIEDELKRIGEGYRSDYQIALSHQEGLEADLKKAVTQSETTNTAQIKLRELQSAAQSSRALYETFLQKLGEAIQQQSFPLTETRVVTAATPPLKKSKPKTLLVLAGALLLGGGLGVGIGWLRDTTDETLRTSAQAEFATESLCVASIPFVSHRRNENLLFEVTRRPRSAFAESIRELKMATEVHSLGNLHLIGFTSALSGEGKSTVAANFAALMARARKRVIVVDCDIRNPTISKLAPDKSPGLIDVLLHKASFDHAILSGLEGGYDILPVAPGSDHQDSSDLISSDEMRAVFEHLKSQYDMVIVDLPPVLPFVDAKAAAALMDGIIFVTEWGKTSVEVLASATQNAGRVRERLLGIVLNKVDPRLVGRARGLEHEKRYMLAS